MGWRINEIATGMLIKQRCIEKGYTPKQLADIFGVTLTVPYQWFTGKTIPKIDNLVELSKLLECTIEDLLVVEEIANGKSV